MTRRRNLTEQSIKKL